MDLFHLKDLNQGLDFMQDFHKDPSILTTIESKR